MRIISNYSKTIEKPKPHKCIICNRDIRIGSYICDNCLTMSSEYCEKCREVVLSLNNIGLCGHLTNRLPDGGYKPNMTPFGNYKKEITYGFEVELMPDYDYKRRNIVQFFRMHKNNTILGKTDGSISDGIEFVSFPFTEKFFKKMSEIFYIDFIYEYGFHSCRQGGMHVHISNNFLTGRHIHKLFNIMAKHYEFFKVFSERSIDKLEQWACIHRDDKYIDNAVNKFIAIKNGIRDTHYLVSRSSAINVLPKNTVEIRLFAGPKSPEELKANLQLCFILVKFIQDKRCKTFNAFKSMIFKSEYNELKTKTKGVLNCIK
jgi:hypothetical protein